ncbi:hypothetical protein NEHOM01_2004 [Nematocida homosporus]|uniref:uncharacterized protein n=1 Tax=Nematocida homosporus TaxID=1912981 RepID=UPI00221EDC5E|nr:uncharacterized protein NEHOM01_2004 [Nematocida homosporus]KAI5187199.1 hypothetical protein NEHOM01_2004 [Nematocida homosporus]
MSYLEIVKGVDRNRIYRGQTIRYRIVVVLWSLVLVLDSVRGGCSDSKVGGVSDVGVQEITAPEGWERSPRLTEDLKALGFSFQYMKSVVYVKKHITEEVTAPASDSTVSSSPTNSTENIDKYMVLWPEPELQFIMPKTREAYGLQRFLIALMDIVVIKAEKAVFVYQLEYLERCEDKLKAISRVINMLECEELELRIEEYDIERYSHWASEVEPSLTELEETIDCAGSNSKRSLTINVYCLNPSIVDLKPLNMSLRNLASKPALIVTIMRERKPHSFFFNPKYLSRDLPEVQVNTNIDFTALHNQEIKCQKIVIEKNIVLTLTGLENATTNIHSEIVLELYWDTLLYLCEHNRSNINVHTIIAIGCGSRRGLFKPELLQKEPPSTPHIFATKISTIIPTQLYCSALIRHTQYCNQEACAKYGISAAINTIEYEEGQAGLVETLNTLKNKLCALYETSVDNLDDEEARCSGQDKADHMWLLQETVNIHLENKLRDSCDNWIIRSFCQNICYTDINIYGLDWVDWQSVSFCKDLLNRFGNITARTLRISNIYLCPDCRFGLSTIEEDDALPEIFRRRLDIKALILDQVNNDFIYWILNNYTFADSMELHILNQGYKNLNIVQILSLPICRNISKLVLNDFIGLDEVRLYEEYKKEGRLTELSLFNYIETMKAENKTITDLGLNKLTLRLEGVDCNKYTEILAKFNDIGIQCEEVPFAVIVGRQLANYNSYIRGDTQCALRNPNKRFKMVLELKNINLQELEADLARRCPESTSQPDPKQEQKSPIQKLSVDKLSLHFIDEPVITENNLVRVLKWIACHFTGPRRLYLYGLEVSEDEQETMIAHHYQVIGLNAFSHYHRKVKLIVLRSLLDDNQGIVFAEFNIIHPDIVIVNSITIPHILKLDLTEIDPEACLYKLATAIKKSTSIVCLGCSLSLYQPKEKNRTDREVHVDIDNDTNGEAREEKSKEDAVRQKEILSPKYDFTGFSPKLHTTIACYLACGHILCIKCISKMVMPDDKLLKCPTCEKYLDHNTTCELVYAPLPNFIHIESDVPTSITKNQQAKIKTWRESPAFFYAINYDPYQTHYMLVMDIFYATTPPFQVIFV